MSDFEFVTPSETGVRLVDLIGRAVALKSLGRVETPIETEFGPKRPLRVECLSIRKDGETPVAEKLGSTLVFPDRLASAIDAAGGKWVVGRLVRTAVAGFDDREAWVLEEMDTDHQGRAVEMFAKLV